ncbi:DHS-like NAD/FAD-binding domain-containing protein [Flagelloscypha sp. PMI_526]|nr:DHS-like NAD/FAD-binding domain-containing protein [Flagelloscypha sp. PMI_526]
MRVTVPTLPPNILQAALSAGRTLPAEAIETLANFLIPGNCCVLTGAGVSVDSGIRAYRGQDGRYSNPNYKPIMYHELVDESPKGSLFRKRYWLRSYLGYPPIRDAQPNTTHYALAALQYSGHIKKLVTQNVDGLHHKALSKSLTFGPPQIQERILELHGTLHHVRCKYSHLIDRGEFQTLLGAANPDWSRFLYEKMGGEIRTNPDGDVAIEHLGLQFSYEDFTVPECETCWIQDNRRCDIHKPEVIFFGESIPDHIRDRSFHDIEQCERLLIIGSTLATYSSFRLLKHALSLRKPILLLNLGPSRGDNTKGVQRVDINAGLIMRDVVRRVLGPRAIEDDIVKEMLVSGIVKPPAEDDEDRAPRAAG